MMSQIPVQTEEIHSESHHSCHHSTKSDDPDSDNKFNMIVNKFFQKESFGKGFVTTKEHHVHSKYRATVASDSHFMILNKKGLIKVHERILKK
jgi:hypothetical protein